MQRHRPQARTQLAAGAGRPVAEDGARVVECIHGSKVAGDGPALPLHALRRDLQGPHCLGVGRGGAAGGQAQQARQAGAAGAQSLDASSGGQAADSVAIALGAHLVLWAAWAGGRLQCSSCCCEQAANAKRQMQASKRFLPRRAGLCPPAAASPLLLAPPECAAAPPRRAPGARDLAAAAAAPPGRPALRRAAPAQLPPAGAQLRGLASGGSGRAARGEGRGHLLHVDCALYAVWERQGALFGQHRRLLPQGGGPGRQLRNDGGRPLGRVTERCRRGAGRGQGGSGATSHAALGLLTPLPAGKRCKAMEPAVPRPGAESGSSE